MRDYLDARALEGESAPEGDAEGRFLGAAIRKALGEGAWAQYRRRLSLPSDKGTVCILELNAGEAVYRGIAERLSRRYRCLFRMHLNRGLYFISGDLPREDAETLLTGALEAGTGACYGIGACRRGPELYLSCGEALEELRNKRSPSRERERQRIIALRRRMGAADPGELKKAFTTLWEDICARQDFTLAKAKLVSLFMFLIDDCFGSYRSHTGEPPPFAAAEEIMALEDLRAWEIWSAEAFDRLLRRSVLNRSSPVPLPLDKAVKYIETHGAGGIQLIDAASAAQVSPAYLSRLFSEHFKISFTDYITERRIERAEKLIRKSRMNMKEIAFAVGYQDPNYFSKIFKKVTGMLPTQYAAAFRSGHDGAGYPRREEQCGE